MFYVNHASWTGGSAVKELADSGICLQSFPILEGCAKKVDLRLMSKIDVSHY